MNRSIDDAAALLAATFVLVVATVSQTSHAADAPGAGFVAGLAPHQRPEGAPAIKDFTPDPAWRSRALTGVSAPIPASLRFLDDQGAWYTPFNHPGWPGYYDLRRWFGGATQTTVKQVR
ncbi:MAG: hypothetical protein JNK59_07240 [Sterolibacteriaceae bacterium]|nr:hypothetical protein [Sterolibacteriaceae bacterium]